MIISTEVLKELEQHIGHNCKITVTIGSTSGDVSLAVRAIMSSGQTYLYEENFTLDYLTDLSTPENLYGFRERVKRQLAHAFGVDK